MGALGRLVTRYRGIVILGWLTVAVLAAPGAMRIAELLTLDLPSATPTEAARVRGVLDSTFGKSAAKAFAVVVDCPTDTDGRAPA